MSLYRCSVCGSPNVTCESRLSGIKYDYAKGVQWVPSSSAQEVQQQE